MNDCIFCKIVKGEIPCSKVFENDDVLAFLDIAPLAEGHTLVIPKKHFETMDQVTPDISAKIAEVFPLISKAICKATGKAAFNIFQNNGRPAGQLVDHVHYHIVPRTEDDAIIRLGKQLPYPDGKMQQVADNIVKALQE